jgi:hypothetical protein
MMLLLLIVILLFFFFYHQNKLKGKGSKHHFRLDQTLIYEIEQVGRLPDKIGSSWFQCNITKNRKINLFLFPVRKSHRQKDTKLMSWRLKFAEWEQLSEFKTLPSLLLFTPFDVQMTCRITQDRYGNVGCTCEKK